MKKRFYYFSLLLCFVFLAFSGNIKEVLAKETLTLGRKEAVYYTRQGANKPYTSDFFPLYSMNGKTVYCIEPGVGIYFFEYNGTKGITKSPYSAETNYLIQLIGHYGYEYPGHNTVRYRMATQALIWEKVGGQTVEFYTERYGYGNEIDVSYEKNQIMKLVNSHKTEPNFSKTNLSGNLGDTIVLEDKNKVLSYFDVSDSNNNPVKKEGNKLYITLKNPGTSKIKLKKARYDSKATIVYSTTKGVGQKVAILRASDEVEMEMNLEVKAKLKIVKVDKDTNEVIKKAGFKFKLKDLKTNEYVCENTSCTFETNTDGEVTTKSLLSGEYELEEVDELMEPYTWNKEKVKIKIDSNSEIVDNVIVFKYANKRVSGKIVIKKLGENLTLKDNDFTYEEIPLKDVKYELYAKDDIYFNNELKYKKDTLVSSLITNEKGEGILENLYLGSYYLIETESSNGHIVDKEKHYFELTYEDQYKEIIEKDFDFKNYLPKGKLEFLKIDSKTGKPLSNTLIEIHLKGEEDKIIYKGETDKNGKIVLNDLPLGDYYIKEVKSREGYYLTDEIINFSIKEDSEVITLKMENTPIEEIEVPKTGIDNPWFSSLFTASLATFSLPTIYLFRKKLLEK